ncbi:MAG: hypothetical protein KAI15_06375 [Gammaproteobacteria bacterium]|nr:hypothetical protein [Gammaproteobacteria bacterium]
MSRYRAFGIHLLISSFVFIAFLLIMLRVWYPDFYFEASAGWGVLKILLLVDVVLGPLITLIIFKSGKPGLRFDLSVLVLLQLSALIYGASVIYENRPVYLVFAVDRFEIIPAGAIDVSEIKDPGSLTGTDGRPPVVFASPPEDLEERSNIAMEVIMGGKDIELRPSLYSPFMEHIDAVLSKGVDIDALMQRDEISRQQIDKFAVAQDSEPGDFSYYPLMGKNKDMLAALSTSDGSWVGVIDINPWAEASPED